MFTLCTDTFHTINQSDDDVLYDGEAGVQVLSVQQPLQIPLVRSKFACIIELGEIPCEGMLTNQEP